jgi:osmoprotectant transport system permease protein
MVWSWIPGNLGLIGQLTRQNAYIGIVSAVVGLVIAIPLGIASARWRWLYPPVLSTANIIYALPSLALFVALIDYTGLSDTTVIIPLTLYSLVVILPNVVDGLRSVPDDVRQAATAMGFGPLRRLAQVELPLAGPMIIAGARVATVSNISLVSVGQLIGIGGLGYFFTDGLARDFPTEVYVGLILIVTLALACDLLLVLSRRLLTPWQRDGQSGSAP